MVNEDSETRTWILDAHRCQTSKYAKNRSLTPSLMSSGDDEGILSFHPCASSGCSDPSLAKTMFSGIRIKWDPILVL